MRDIYWNPPFLVGIMSGKRFIKMGECIRLNHNDPPSYKVRFFRAREIIDGFNNNMKKHLIHHGLFALTSLWSFFIINMLPGGLQ